ncbi:MAG: 3'-5' exonuclease [Crocinitomicaceae bacterium]|jgi:3'-5' exonuclease|nr:3'-5' exonuclease [Crocinitomicaceae bacterium]MDP4722729.1 3'-5' exonuclease [Crocinitomicaceae bacterium]MDP4738732.1 3'-5' exonuclease [Crocinitomicaceae bacterium]MDP4798810.1 3'-5' exonuclease [Crocinitomicaceae bacterium]MDP4806412.1 3'-5' exonuclease [Crocinitomicaceae bacterium]
MIKQVQFEKILFLDIETVPQAYQFEQLDDKSKALFEAKNRFQISPEKPIEQIFEDRGGILAEFGKIVCISVGMLHEGSHGKSIRLKSYYHDDEETLLVQFKRLLEDHYNTPYHVLCGHNSKEFDIPYICRRMLINGIALPSILQIAGKKPWEINHIDTMELWKFGDYKSYTSLSLLCHVMQIPTPKDDISGADVARVYYEEQDLQRIMVYCEKDVVALIQLFLRLQGEPLVDDFNITSASTAKE